jgi:predicted DCC family thiol-disulfide oxidoreductase YuxK
MIILFDGYCVLCSAFARWLKKKLGAEAALKAMQSSEGRKLLEKNGFSPETIDEVIVILPGTILTGPEAIVFILTKARGFWSAMARVVKWMPPSLIRWLYRVIAKNRYNWFGKRQNCTIL